MYFIEFFTTSRGESPIDKFLDNLEDNGRSKVLAWIERLSTEGPNLRRPFADVVRGKIRELRIPYKGNQYRILYFFILKNKIVLVHALNKKDQKLRSQDIDLAEQRMKEYQDRFRG